METPRSPSPTSSRHHLLTSSRPASILTTNTETTLTDRASQETLRASPIPVQRTQSTPAVPYRGFPSKEAYLKALVEFADSKKYYEMDNQLIGFYGTKTTADILSEEGGWRSKTKAQRQAEKDRKKSEVESRQAGLAVVGEEGGQFLDGSNEGRPMRRFSRGFERVFARRGTVG